MQYLFIVYLVYFNLNYIVIVLSLKYIPEQRDGQSPSELLTNSKLVNEPFTVGEAF